MVTQFSMFIDISTFQFLKLFSLESMSIVHTISHSFSNIIDEPSISITLTLFSLNRRLRYFSRYNSTHALFNVDTSINVDSVSASLFSNFSEIQKISLDNHPGSF